MNRRTRQQNRKTESKELLDPKQDIYSSDAALWITRVIGVLSAAALLITLWYINDAIRIQGPESGKHIAIAAGCWAVGAPIWFWFEYFWLYRECGNPGSFDLYKHGQQLSIAIWAGLALSLSALAGNDMFKRAADTTTEFSSCFDKYKKDLTDKKANDSDRLAKLACLYPGIK